METYNCFNNETLNKVLTKFQKTGSRYWGIDTPVSDNDFAVLVSPEIDLKSNSVQSVQQLFNELFGDDFTLYSHFIDENHHVCEALDTVTQTIVYFTIKDYAEFSFNQNLVEDVGYVGFILVEINSIKTSDSIVDMMLQNYIHIICLQDQEKFDNFVEVTEYIKENIDTFKQLNISVRTWFITLYNLCNRIGTNIQGLIYWLKQDIPNLPYALTKII